MTIKATPSLMIRRAGETTWGTLQSFEYLVGVDGSRKKALRELRTRQSGWATNYAQFRDASFKVEDSAAPSAVVVVPGYVSPRLAAAAASTRTEAEVRAARQGMPDNAPHNALRAAVTRAIASGAPVFVNQLANGEV